MFFFFRNILAYCPIASKSAPIHNPTIQSFTPNSLEIPNPEATATVHTVHIIGFAKALLLKINIKKVKSSFCILPLIFLLVKSYINKYKSK